MYSLVSPRPLLCIPPSFWQRVSFVRHFRFQPWCSVIAPSSEYQYHGGATETGTRLRRLCATVFWRNDQRFGGARLESGIIKRGCIKVYKQQQGTDEQVEDDAGRIVQRGE